MGWYTFKKIIIILKKEWNNRGFESKLHKESEAFSDHDLLSKNKRFNFPGLQMGNDYFAFRFKLK